MEGVSGWKKRKPHEGYGVAITECFASPVGQIGKVSKDANGKIKIDHVWAVIDCGWYVNPDIVKAQVEKLLRIQDAPHYGHTSYRSLYYGKRC